MDIEPNNIKLLKYLSNIPGWTTKRKFIVIESDDWGSIRMPSQEVFKTLADSGIDWYSDSGLRFNKYDTLATSEDLANLFEVLSSNKDSLGRQAVITALTVVGNPNFEKVREANFQEYFYEPFTDTLKRYPGCENAFSMWKEGLDSKLFVPQFHGREHLNVQTWMKALKGGNKNTILAFNHKMWGISTAKDPGIGIELQAAFDFVDPKEIDYQKNVITSGLNLFEDLFGYRAKYFVPTNGPFSSKLESLCRKEGIKFIVKSKIEREPYGFGKTRLRFNWLGKRSKYGLTYITRNCIFEPSQAETDCIDGCLSDISNAFKWHKPAVISSHRVNYIGALHEDNRNNGLAQLNMLLKKIVKIWPSIEFISSDELGEIIDNEKHNE